MAFQFNLEKEAFALLRSIGWHSCWQVAIKLEVELGSILQICGPFLNHFLCFFSMDSLKHLHSPSYLSKGSGFLAVKSPWRANSSTLPWSCYVKILQFHILAKLKGVSVINSEYLHFLVLVQPFRAIFKIIRLNNSNIWWTECLTHM